MSGLLERGCSIIVDATSFLRSMQFRSLDSVTDATKNGKMDGNAAISVFGYCHTSSEKLSDCVVTLDLAFRQDLRTRTRAIVSRRFCFS